MECCAGTQYAKQINGSSLHNQSNLSIYRSRLQRSLAKDAQTFHECAEVDAEGASFLGTLEGAKNGLPDGARYLRVFATRPNHEDYFIFSDLNLRILVTLVSF